MPGSLAEYQLTHAKLEGDNMEVMTRVPTWLPSHLEGQREEKREESRDGPKDVRECVFPPINLSQSQRGEKDDHAVLMLYEQQRKLEDNRCLLAELARIEQELRESLQREEEKQRALDKVRQEENRLRWKNLCFLSLNQRTAKPWVNSYYKNIPMHIYCLPIKSLAHKNSKMKRKKWRK
ncbi:hypothetical protein AALO_G00221860 [Alosa alosa]|uniref:Uncharacterized protein n=1 Tax=Alosa alosa TaxID=278164 RepID=A0AAV6FXI0_9TELE|nr:hypothetical protein AALO_G00221860 [Alosa alosa]